MTTRGRHREHDIQAALRKLKNDANAKELELIKLVASIYESVKDKQDKAKESIEDAASVVNTSVHLHPWRYISGAVLGGVLVGCILRKRR